MKKCMKFFDLFALNFKFNIKNKVLLKTVWGGIFSVLLILLTVALVIYNCYTFFKHRTLSLINSEIFIVDKLGEKFDLNNISFITYLADGNLSSINMDYVYNISTFTSIDFNPLSFSKNSIGSIDKCSNATNNDSITLAKQLQNMIKMDTENSYCFNKYISIDSVKLGGSPGITQEFRDIENYMLFDLCSNKDLQSNCKSQVYLKEYLYNYFISYYNYYNDVSSELGYKKFLDYEMKVLSASEDVIISIKLQKNIVNLDNNYLFNFVPIKTYQYYTYSKVDISSRPRLSNYTNELSVIYNIQLDKYQKVYNISYMKLDQLLANTMSIFSVLLFIFENLTKFVEYRSVEYHLMKKLYYFNSKKDNPLIRKKNKILLKKTNLSCN